MQEILRRRFRPTSVDFSKFCADRLYRWKLTSSKDELPPVDSFWSLSLYRLPAEGQSYFTDNPINRYAIGDRTPDLKRGTAR